MLIYIHVIVNLAYIYISQEMFEDTKVIIRSRISKKIMVCQYYTLHEYILKKIYINPLFADFIEVEFDIHLNIKSTFDMYEMLLKSLSLYLYKIESA